MIEDEDEGVVFADGFDDAIIGIMRIDGAMRVVYDKWAMVNVMRAQETELSFESVVEFLEYNTWGSYVGPNTPIYMYCVHGSGDEKKEEVLDYAYDCLW